MFFYPEKDASNMSVKQFVNADLGGTGLAHMVKNAAEESIKVCTCCKSSVYFNKLTTESSYTVA